MAGLETIFLGSITARILHGVSAEQAGWLVQALLRWVLDKEEPAPEEIPPEYLGSWIAIHDESVNIANIRKHRQYAGFLGGKAPDKTSGKKGSAKQTEANGSKRKQTAKTAKQTEANAKQTQANRSFARARIDRDREVDIRFGSSEPNPKRADARGGFAASASDSASDSVDTSFNFFICDERELVPMALKLIGEPGNDRMRGRLAKFRRNFGAKKLREELTTFAAELAAGEEPANRAATLNARLSGIELAGTIEGPAE